MNWGTNEKGTMRWGTNEMGTNESQTRDASLTSWRQPLVKN